ncbi:MAG: antitoxin VapB family protein [Candidatus Woesearchaeota archaeon]
MATKTITITENAYETLRGLKRKNESFSKTILRLGKRKPLSYFFGALSKESGVRLEKAIYDLRKIKNEQHKKSMAKLIKELEE